MCETNLHRATCIQDPPSPSKKMLEEKKLIMNVDLVKMWIICRIPFLIHGEREAAQSHRPLSNKIGQNKEWIVTLVFIFTGQLILFLNNIHKET